MFMQNLDSTVIATALPTMAKAFGAAPVHMNVALTSYLLSLAVFIPASGWVADRYGTRTVFRAAIAVFTIGSILCGRADSLAFLVGARVLQGIGGAMMVPVGRLVLLRTAAKQELVAAMAWLTVPALLGPVLGPPVGGFIVTYFSWRWIFFINLPVAILGVVLVTIFIDNVREETVTRLDWRGFILTGFGLAGVVYGFENLGRNVLPFATVLGMLGGGAVCLAIYGWHAKRTPHAILDLSVFRLPSFMTATIGGTPLRMAMGATPFLLALLLQMGFGLSALEAGLITFTSAAGALLMKATARPIIARFGFKHVLVWNTLITSTVFMGYGLFRASTPHWLIISTLLIGGFFRSLQFTALNALAYADIEQAGMSRASSLASVGQQLSQSLGIGFAAILLGMLRHGHGAAGLHALRASDISPAFVIIGAISFLGLAFFLPLPHDVGAEVSGRRPREDRGPVSLTTLTPVED
jgi:EmrB/QacA subfamily drug resistance transporter